MKILIATSEPWGTYHSRYVMPELLAQGITAAHLVPDIEHLAKPGFSRPNENIPVQPGLDAVLDANLLVINWLTPGSWPAQAAEVAWKSGIPVLFSHLAYLGQDIERAISGPLCGVTAASPSDALDVSAHLSVNFDKINIVGTPALDSLPPYTPENNCVLIVTSVSAEINNEENTLLLAAINLSQCGVKVRVALHPRENPNIWSSFEIATGDTLLAAANASTVLGVPGSIFPSLAALGIPLVRVVNAELDAHIPKTILDLATPLLDPSTVVETISLAEHPSKEQIDFLVGPTPGATNRLTRYWIDRAAK